MRRDFRGKLCAYCGEELAESDDHVFGREFFPVPFRGNLPKVPACKDCNNKKFNLENYAMAVFPFGANHPVGSQMLRGKVMNRLRKNRPLFRELRRGTKDVRIVNPNGSVDSTIAIPFDPKKAFALFELVVRGLLWHHFKAPLPADHDIRMLGVTKIGQAFFDEKILSMSPENFQEVSLADGAATYSFTHNTDDPFFSVWMLSIYGALSIGANAGDGRLLGVYIAAVTGPPKVIQVAVDYEQIGSRGSSPSIIPLTT